MTFDDKRKHPRFQSLNLSYVCLDENNEIVKQGMGRTLNISESGILLETYFPIKLEYKVLLMIGLADDLLEIKGKPIHSRSDFGKKFEVGIEFLELDQDSGQLLKKFIERVELQDETKGERDE